MFQLLDEHEPLLISIELYFIKRHLWRVKKFHKTIHNAWNIFKCSKQLSENSAKIQFSRVSINREELSINRRLFSIDRTRIEHRSNQAKTPGYYSSLLRLIEQKFRSIEHTKFWISVRKFHNLNFHFIHFINEYSPTLYHYYNLSLYIYLYI